MKLPFQRFLSILAGLTLVFGSTFTVSAAREAQSTGTLYVSSTGSGTSCTQAAPCSMSTGAKNLAAGKTLFLLPGNYNAALQITKSGTAAQPIKVNGPASVKGVTVTGSYVELTNLEIAGATGHGIAISGKHIKFSNFSVHDNVNENKSGSACTGTGSWGSGLKVSVGGEDVQISNGQVFHNCGEGLAVTRGINVTISNVTAYDNFSANFYIDNSKQVTLQKSFSYCTSDSNYYRSGQPASGILIGEEYYSGWGGQLSNLTIVNNISYGCKGLNFYGVESGVPNGGLVGALIAHNTIWNVYAGGKAISISSQPANSDIVIGNNLVGGAIAPANATVVKNQSTANFLSTPGYTLASFLPAQTSPGVNAGATLGVAVDINSRTRDTLPDVGAWESTNSPTTVTPSSPTPTKTAVKTATATRTSAPTLKPPTPTASGQTATPIHRGVTVLDLRIAAGNDDAEEGASGSVYLDSSDLELIYDSSLQVIGLRFTGVKLPAGATIVNAYLQFKVDETSSTAVNLSIQGEASPNAAAFSSAAHDLSMRARTAASTAWTPPAWPTANASGLDQRTPDLSPVIQEIVNQAGWASGNALALVITGSSNKRVAQAFEGSAAGAPLLHIEYTAGGLLPEQLTTPTSTPSPVSSPTATATDIVTATPSPTSTPAPTDTPAPTETPEPTGTPFPTETPLPTETSTEVLPPTEPVTPTPTAP
ncbi:MAG: hypothetical protein HY869_17740 [Chloroflexi bacterium]|nr:hypothetical protein [Chloroflexota bacterium]